MKIEDLIALKAQADNLIKAKEKDAKRDLINSFKQQAAAAGFTLDELFGGAAPKTTRRSSGKVAPKYRNPNNASQTWTGRGKQPIWVREILAQGRSLESIAI